jgi:phosphoribosylanthranilate isomerase
MAEPRVKICGITREADARAALAHGAWALGFIFHRPSPRSIEPEAARRIVQALPPEALTIGVFVDRPIEEVQAIVERVGLKGVQLHGAETPELAARIDAGLVIKAFRVGAGFDPAAVDAYDCELILLDSFREGVAGGTGETFDWEAAKALAARRPLMLAGGIRPENAAAALRAVQPFGIDVSSGVEASPGVKDSEKLAALFASVRGAGGSAG